MQTFKVVVTQTAELEITSCFEFIAKDSIANAVNWYNRLHEKLRSLETMPGRRPLADENDYFEFDLYCLLINRYRVLYRINGLSVEVMHVKSPNQNR